MQHTASRGVGAELARIYAREGAYVVVNYFQSKDRAETVVTAISELHGPGRALAVYGDVRVKADMEALVATAEKHFEMRVSVLVNNAIAFFQFNPATPSASIKTVTADNLEQQMKGSLVGSVHAVQACLPSFEAANFGKVVNVGTNLVYNPVVTYYDYTAAKAALVALTRNLAAELGPMGVRVNLVAYVIACRAEDLAVPPVSRLLVPRMLSDSGLRFAPVCSGGLLETTDASALTTKEVFGFVAAGTPLRKATTVNAFAEACVYFAADASNAVTGQSLSIDGGLTMP